MESAALGAAAIEATDSSPRREPSSTSTCVPALLWLEDVLLAERRAVEATIVTSHKALLQELAPKLEGIRWNKRAFSGKASCCFNGALSMAFGSANPSASMDIDTLVEQQMFRIGGVSHAESHPSDAQPERNRAGTSPHPMTVPLKEQPTAGTNLKFVPGSPVSRRKSLNAKATGTDEVSLPGRWQTFLHYTETLVTSAQFEGMFALLIVLNALFMAFEAQYRGIETGFRIHYNGASTSAADAWPGAVHVFEVMEWIFGVLFTLELVLKISCLRLEFFFDPWNLIDFVIVGCWLFTSLGSAKLPVDPMLLRLARLGRLLRLLKLVRTIRLFDSLYLMTTAIKGSASMLFWSVVVLALVQMMIAFTLQQLVESYILDEQNPPERRREVYMFYGTFARSLLSMFEITLGNWMVPARALVENISEWYMIFSLAHKLVIGFSVVSVLTGVFIQETFKVATTDDRVMMMSKERAKKIHADKMALLFAAADLDGDGVIDFEEFHRALADTEVRTWLSAMELEVRDEGALFSLLDLDGDGHISHQELLEGVAQLKGGARSYEVCSLSHNTREMRDMLQSVLDRLPDRLPELHCWRLAHTDRLIVPV